MTIKSPTSDDDTVARWQGAAVGNGSLTGDAGEPNAAGAAAVTAGVGGNRSTLRAWLGAVRAPRLAAASAAATLYAVIEMLRVLGGSLAHGSALGAVLLVFASGTLIATLPDTTVLWRVAALGVGLNAGPLLHRPMQELSVTAFLDAWAAAIGGDGSGVLLMFLVAALVLLPLEAFGAWLRRGRLAAEVERRRQRDGAASCAPRS